MKNPISREAIDLPDNLKETLKKEQFLLVDSQTPNKPDKNRILIFATLSFMSILNSTDYWFVDGTFDVRQLFYNI